ncbi:hypothetical protein GCM10007216_25620 [Thalassobacillus devorans]|uniref:DUF4178 domain-containing protein n=1 Tax=Thalassobacillus devorans TaxID=279813 RepID=A0ABQ1PBL1_9BACI|nr:hypothetical protein [Thalassobacillus devorans]GGC93756.1 hypothetical protein GCM10007216_25620 [Thalassobacillus devorans]
MNGLGLLSRLFSNKKAQVPKVKERTPLNIQVGDIVNYELVDYEVVGKITYREHAYEWFGYQLLEGRSTIWLSAEMDDELELGIYRTIKLPVSQPFPSKLEYEGNAFHKDSGGQARVVGEGRSSNVNGQMIQYADYISEDEKEYLSVEAWGSDTEVSLGHDIEPYDIKIIAGSH